MVLMVSRQQQGGPDQQVGGHQQLVEGLTASLPNLLRLLASQAIGLALALALLGQGCG
jgi:hypothetical protein